MKLGYFGIVAGDVGLQLAGLAAQALDRAGEFEHGVAAGQPIAFQAGERLQLLQSVGEPAHGRFVLRTGAG